MIKREIKIELETILNDLQVNLENNYKDLAHAALKKLHIALESHLENGTLKKKEYDRYKKIADDYSVKMADYHH